MNKNINGTDVEEGGNQEQRRRIPPARQVKVLKLRIVQEGGKSKADGQPGTSKQSNVEPMKGGEFSGSVAAREALDAPRSNLQEKPEPVQTPDQVQPFFTGVTFKLAGFPELRQEELSDCIVEADGELVSSDYGGTVDYLIVPTGGWETTAQSIGGILHRHLVSDLWLEDCLDSGQLLPAEYHHRAVGQVQGQLLKGVVACLSGYGGREREFLSKLVIALGGVSQEVFAKRDNPRKNVLGSTHLICSEAEGPKYNAAKKWKVTVVTKDWLRACLRNRTWVSEKDFLVGEAKTISNQEPELVASREESREIEEAATDRSLAQASPVLKITVARGHEQEKEVDKIAEQASKKMKLEVSAKVREMESLKLQREAAVKRAKVISSAIENWQNVVDQNREVLRRHDEGEEFDKRRIERLNTEQQRIQQEREEIKRGQRKRQRVIQYYQSSLKGIEEKTRKLKEELEETNSNVKKFEKNLADLPSAPGFSHDVVNLLDDQIASKRKELKCPVCFEEAAPPIYSCIAQHLVCANCRLRLEQCGICRVPYEEMLRHRYAEKDHQQMVQLCRQQADLREKLAKRSHSEVDV